MALRQLSINGTIKSNQPKKAFGKNGNLEKSKVLNVDCRKGLKELVDNSVSLVLTDPPYFIDGMGDEWDKEKLDSKIDRAGVIGGLPVGMKFDPNQSKRLRGFLNPIAAEWARVVKPGGFILCFMQPRLAHSATMAMENADIEIRDTLIWERVGQAKAFTQDHFIKKRKDLSEQQKEVLINKIAGRKTPQLKPNHETIILGQVPKEGTFVSNWEKWETGLIDVSNPFLSPTLFPGTIMKAPKPRNRYGHITAKPVGLLRHLIRIFSAESPDTLVLDTFAGSGSTGEASILEGRGFLGFEICEEYAKIANVRIKETMRGMASEC